MHRIELVEKPRPLRIEGPGAPAPDSPVVSLSYAGYLTIELGGSAETYSILIRDEQRPWTIIRLEQDRLSANFQGNPMWPGMALRNYPDLSRYFGLSGAASERACLMPGYSTINNKLMALMPEAGGFSSVNFGYRPVQAYPSDKPGKISCRTYVDTFVDTGKLPFGEHLDRDSVHDWCYHFVTFLFPELMENIRLTLLTIREQLHWFSGDTLYDWNYYGHTLDGEGNTAGYPRRERLSYQSAIYRQMAITLDVATAKVVQVLIMEQNGRLDSRGHELRLLRAYLGGVTYDSLKCILWMERDLERVFQLPQYATELVYEDDPLAYLHSRLTQFDRVAVKLNPADLLAQRHAAFADTLARL